MSEARTSLQTSMSTTSRWLWLVGPLLVLALSFLLRPGAGRSVLLPFVDIPLPESCYFYRLLGIDCPGCGLTRSFLHLSRGNLQIALQVNPLGIVLYTFLILQVPQAGLRWIPNENRRRWLSDVVLSRSTRINEWLMILILIALVFQWIATVVWREYS